MGDHAEARDAR